MADKPTAPTLFRGNTEEHLRLIAQVVNQVQTGYGNNAFTVTLEDTPAVSTEVIRTRAKVDQHANMSPISAAAAADFALGTTYAVTSDGAVTIHHPAGGSDRQYGVVLAG
jgi:hypothetical protein